MGQDGWDDDTKVAAKEDIAQPVQDRDRAYLIVLAGSSVGEMFKITQTATVIGRGSQADIQVVDDGISRRHAEIAHEKGHIVVRDLGSTNGTFCNGERIDTHELQDGDKIQVGSTTILKFTFHDSLDETFQRQMYESALRDGLTKIFNRKYLLDRLESEFAFAVRHKSPLSLIMFDLDHFKLINDTHGHVTGDYTLVTLAQLVQTTIRQEDVFARYGGEEFAVISRGIDAEHAAIFAERVRQAVAGHPFEHGGARIQVTVSVGVASVTELGMRSALDLVGAADEALYAAKHAGRNRVVSAGQRLAAGT